MGNPEVTIPITALGVKELQVIGSFRYCVRLISLTIFIALMLSSAVW